MITRKSKRILDLGQRPETVTKQPSKKRYKPSDKRKPSCDKNMSGIKECSVVCVKYKPSNKRKPSCDKNMSGIKECLVVCAKLNAKFDAPSVVPKINAHIDPKTNVHVNNHMKAIDCTSLDEGDIPHCFSLDVETGVHENKTPFSYSFASDCSIKSASVQEKKFRASRFYKAQKYLNPLERKDMPSSKITISALSDDKKKKVRRSKRNSIKPKSLQIKNVHLKKSKSTAQDNQNIKSVPSDENVCIDEVVKSDDKPGHSRLQRKFFTSRSSSSPEKKVFTTALAWKKSMHVIKSGSTISVKNTSHPPKRLLRCKPRVPLKKQPHVMKLKSIENIPEDQTKTLSSVAEMISNFDFPPDNSLPNINPAIEQVDTIDSFLASPEILSEAKKQKRSKEGEKLYPVFNYRASRKQRKNKMLSSTPNTVKPTVVKLKQFIKETKRDGKEQMIIDAGQRDIGAKHCSTCNMVYTVADASDEKMHVKYHEKFISNLKFPGWKKEHVLAEFYDGRVIMITKEDKRYMLKKIEDVLHIVNNDLGFPDLGFPKRPNVTFLLFISSDKKVIGCIVAESITQANRVVLDVSFENVLPYLPCDQKETGCKSDYPKGNWCSSSDTVKAVCGINRIWTAASHRRQKIASRMIDCLKSNFVFGYVISDDELAFSDPSLDGQEFAASYMGTPNFLVYK